MPIEGITEEEIERGERARPILERSRQFGFLGPGPIDPHIIHAFGFLQALRSLPESGRRNFDSFVDLGVGGGLPGLVLALALPHSSWLFLDTNRKRMDAMQEAVVELGISNRVRIYCERAEVAARNQDVRGQYDVVMARGFAGPAVTAECASPLLRAGGILIVSEPPEPSDRWNNDGLAKLGLHRSTVPPSTMARFFLADQVRSTPESYPRRVGIPEKRPLF